MSTPLSCCLLPAALLPMRPFACWWWWPSSSCAAGAALPLPTPTCSLATPPLPHFSHCTVPLLLPQHRQLELFFPFDPYLLRRSAAHLALPSTYIRWRRGHPSGAVRAQLESESSSDSDGEELSDSELSELEDGAVAAGAAGDESSSSDDDSDSSSSSGSSSGYDSSSESDAVRRKVVGGV